MGHEVERRLNDLNTDFEGVVGESFVRFYCPFLYRDEDAELCRGHIVNQAFSDADRQWTVQRRDVDSFFGSRFESDFVVLRRKGRHAAIEALADCTLRREMHPKILLDDQEVEHYYVGDGDVPSHHTELLLQTLGGPVRLGLKLRPSELLEAQDREWSVETARDLRVPALVSALKSAHLTLFHLLGYRYALSAGGHFLGREVLGRFFETHVGSPRSEAVAAALEHFADYQNIVRPVVEWPEDLTGSLTDRRFYICRTPAWIWAVMVFVRTGAHMHAVLVPCFEDPHAIKYFLDFVHDPPESFPAHLAELTGDQWEHSPSPRVFDWPRSRLVDEEHNVG